MTEDNLLSGDQPGALDPNKDYLTDLIGPGGKFYDPDQTVALKKLAYGKMNSDVMIETKNKAFDDLSADYLRLREEHMKGLNIQELSDQITAKLASSANTQANVEIKDQPVYDPKQVDSLIAERLQQHELTKRQQDNQREVQAKLIERYGNNYKTSVKQQIDDLGVSEDLFNTLAKNNPKLLARTLGLDQPQVKEGFQAPPRSSVNSDNFSPQGGPKRTWAYYQELKKNSPNVYSNPKTQTQMINDHIALGDSFEDGNYHNPLYNR